MVEPKKRPAKGKDAEMEYSTFRILAADGENLSELADKRGLSIAKLYHDLFSETVRKLLIDELEPRLQRLKNRA